jgi:hypothetical protein
MSSISRLASARRGRRDDMPPVWDASQYRVPRWRDCPHQPSRRRSVGWIAPRRTWDGRAAEMRTHEFVLLGRTSRRLAGGTPRRGWAHTHRYRWLQATPAVWEGEFDASTASARYRTYAAQEDSGSHGFVGGRYGRSRGSPALAHARGRDDLSELRAPRRAGAGVRRCRRRCGRLQARRGFVDRTGSTRNKSTCAGC